MDNTEFLAKIHFIVGKGGVGKTLVAEGLAQILAKEYKTLLVELSEESSEDLDPQMAAISPRGHNLWYTKIYPDQTIYEYLSLKIPSQKIREALLSKTLFRALCAAMPGLSDLTRLGKIWYHADEHHGLKEQIFDKIVVDMPSTGFVARFLSIASVVYDAVKVGPIAKEAKLLADYLAHPEHACVHLVSIPEDLVVNESIELYTSLSAQQINWGALCINRLLNLDIGSIADDSRLPPHITTLLDSFRTRLKEESVQQKRLMKHIPLPTIIVRDCSEAETKEALLRAVRSDIACGVRS